MAPAVQEFDLQRAHCLWLDGNPDPKTGIPRTTPALAPNVVYWAVPNGGTRSSGFEGKRLKESGLKPGIHDLHFLRPTTFPDGSVWGLLFGQEWKKPGGILSPAQREMHPRLIRAGMAASCVVDNLVDARAWCILHGLAVRI